MDLATGGSVAGLPAPYSRRRWGGHAGLQCARGAYPWDRLLCVGISWPPGLELSRLRSPECSAVLAVSEVPVSVAKSFSVVVTWNSTSHIFRWRVKE